jgi:transcriptional regulator of acetoin/glycerol metabolism
MKPGNAVLVALRVADRSAFRERLRAALTASQGDVRAAALTLGVYYTTLYRWLKDEPDLKPAEPT